LDFWQVWFSIAATSRRETTACGAMARAWHSVAQRGQFANGRALQLMATHQQRPKMFLKRSTDYSITKTYYSSTKDDLR